MVLYFAYIFYPILIPFPLTAILSISVVVVVVVFVVVVVVIVVVSRYLNGPLPSLLSSVVPRGSIPSLPRNHLEGFCVVLSLKRQLLCVPHISQHWVCVSSSWCWCGISIRCGRHHTRMIINMRGHFEFSFYYSNSPLGYP